MQTELVSTCQYHHTISSRGSASNSRTANRRKRNCSFTPHACVAQGGTSPGSGAQLSRSPAAPTGVSWWLKSSLPSGLWIISCANLSSWLYELTNRLRTLFVSPDKAAHQERRLSLKSVGTAANPDSSMIVG